MRYDEINEKMATEVMGWELRSRRTKHKFISEELWCQPDSWVVMMDKDDWNPARNINHAMMVVKKLATWFLFDKIFDMCLLPSKEWTARFSIDEKYSASHYDPAMAICLAAIKVLDSRKK